MKLAEAVARIDQLMTRAGEALVGRHYFETERLCVEAMTLAFQFQDFERMARITLPLQESRRLKRQLAADAGMVAIVDGEMPARPRPGCYLVRPPRVGLDGRMLREMADQAEVPVIVLVREPRTKAGTWPLVALGPVTIRAYVAPPVPPSADAPAPRGRKKPARKPDPVEDPDRIAPPVEWFLLAGEVLGDAAIASVDPGRPPASRVEELWLRLQAFPDHEKLHQALAAACQEARIAGPLTPVHDDEDEVFDADEEREPDADDEADA